MKKLVSLLLALVATVAVSAQSLPNLKVEDLAGKEIAVRSLVGEKPLIMCFWAITCKPCIMEINTINDQIEEWRKMADFNVVVVSVDDVRMKSKARSFAQSNGWDWGFTCLFDYNQALKRAMNVSLTPQSFVFDKQGNVVFSHSGYTPGSEQQLIEKVIEISKK